jgi:hypothetical protein
MRACYVPTALALALGTPAAAGETVLEVLIHDASAFDWIAIRHDGGCDALTGRLHVDFGPSAGQVVIDTEYGGGGTLHPRPVQVVEGPGEVVPVEDGARGLGVELFGLAPGGQVVVTLDMDSGVDLDRPGAARSIVARGVDIAGSLARFTAPGAQTAEAEFDERGAAVLTVPCVPPGLV